MGKALQFSSQNTVDCYSISLNEFFFYDFFLKLSLSILVRKTLQFSSQNIVNCCNVFFHGFFSFQNYLCRFFLILTWQRIQLCNFFFFLLTKKLSHVGKTLYISSQNTVNCYKSFYLVSKFLITNTTFFFRHEILAQQYIQFLLFIQR